MPKLHQATPCFHGDRVRLRAGSRTKAHFSIVESLDCGSAEGVAIVFLPVSAGDAIVEACAAFNAVMDAHQRGAEIVEKFSARTEHLQLG